MLIKESSSNVPTHLGSGHSVAVVLRREKHERQRACPHLRKPSGLSDLQYLHSGRVGYHDRALEVAACTEPEADAADTEAAGGATEGAGAGTATAGGK